MLKRSISENADFGKKTAKNGLSCQFSTARNGKQFTRGFRPSPENQNPCSCCLKIKNPGALVPVDLGSPTRSNLSVLAVDGAGTKTLGNYCTLRCVHANTMKQQHPPRYYVKKRLLEIQAHAEALLRSVASALEEIKNTERVRVQKWRCTRCGHVAWYTHPVPVEACFECDKCKGVKFVPDGSND